MKVIFHTVPPLTERIITTWPAFKPNLSLVLFIVGKRFEGAQKQRLRGTLMYFFKSVSPKGDPLDMRESLIHGAQNFFFVRFIHKNGEGGK